MQGKHVPLNTKKRVMFLENVNLIFLLLIITWSLTPYINRNFHEAFLIFIFMGWWVSKIFISLKRKEGILYIKDLVHPITIIWLIIFSLYVINQIPNFSFGNYYYVVLYYIPIFFFSHYRRLKNQNYNRIIIYFTILLLITNSIINISFLTDNPYAAKELTGGYGLNDMSRTNVIGDNFILGYVLVIYGILALLHFSTNKIIRMVLSIFIVIITIMIIQTTFFIAIISLILIFTLFTLVKGIKNINILLKFLSFIIAISLFSIFIDPLIQLINVWITSVTNNYIIIERVHILTNLLSNFSFEGTLEARIKDIAISLETFTNNPFFGKGYLISDNIISTGIGMHSHFFDDLARFGLISFTIELLVYLFFFQSIFKQLNKNLRKYYIVSIVGFIFYAMFNPVVYPPTGIILFCILPLTFQYIDTNIRLKLYQDKNI